MKKIKLGWSLMPSSINGQMIVMVSVLVLLQIAVSVVIFNGLASEFLEDSLGKRTLDIAKTVARMPAVKKALRHGDRKGELQAVISGILNDTGARFIVVGKPDGTRLTHPLRDRIGKTFVGGDFGRAVEQGEFYVSRSVGTLGPSLRAFAPVTVDEGVIGFVSVGYLETKVSEVVRAAREKPMVYFFMMLFVGLLAANLIAGYVKKVTLGLEPHEIASIHQEREIILNSVREGILACNELGRVRFANKEAERLLEASDPAGCHVDDLIPQAYLLQRLDDMAQANDEEIMVNDRLMICNIVPLTIRNKPAGVVASFRRKDEMDYLNSELRQAKQNSDLLRVQSHEYSNKLHTISGLLQIEEVEEAKHLILKESEGYHSLLDFVDHKVNSSLIGGLILGKYNKASELKCEFKVDTKGGFFSSPPRPEDIVTILGNLLDNAMDAAKENRAVDPVVRCGLHENDNVFRIVVEDSGPGLPETLDIFKKGVSTKNRGRGIGLYNLGMALNTLGGTIENTPSALGGTKFIVDIPKGLS